ncbi:ATP-grasp domain-containing protein [Xenorhabdus innexi]|uniref:Cycloserine biosynthesis protein DcsG n=1 Tax=Xenorhabdus innexi TaxID=290109 RepID=A0A1N6MRL2_9GAMM|nr:hypothetical protein [Xenorhabdus innexi]PHM38493.1 Cycloserine biosynthesis protein DcsG [Xenorhabdus innexi]SIP71488.1 conserved hypothetical protein [Xenorhabdus innexi]
MNTVALITDEASLSEDYDMPLLLEACRTIGLGAEVCSWKDPTIDWSHFDAVLLRSPWSYVSHLPEFLAWCERISALTELFNPLSAVRWNLDKFYLADLAAYGVPVVPSRFISPGMNILLSLREFLAEHPEAEEIVIKPTVGAYSKDVQRYKRQEENKSVEHITYLTEKGCHVILQPYLESVDSDGETNLTYFDGVYSHAIRKGALLMSDGTVNFPLQEFRRAREAGEDERAVASFALDTAVRHMGLEGALLYGRVDLVRSKDGNPIVLEIEICEPSLNLPFAEGSAMRFAQALAGRVMK